jgi:shikimate kinase
MVVALIGMRGSGKTTVGRRLAERLGVPFVDTDAEVERRVGRPIADLFAAGEVAEFRRVEAAVVAAALAGPDAVVATGGGCVEDPATRGRLAVATTVWLTAPAAVLAARCEGSGRPPLTDLGGVAEFEAVLARREALYRECARVTVGTDGRGVEEVCEEIVATLRSPHPRALGPRR